MDVYLSAEESLAFQGMLDHDIKCELDSVWTGGSGEEFGFTHIDTYDENSCSNMNLSWHALSSNNLDLIEGDDALMVNLNSVIPLSLQPRGKFMFDLSDVKIEEDPIPCRTPSPNPINQEDVPEVKFEPIKQEEFEDVKPVVTSLGPVRPVTTTSVPTIGNYKLVPSTMSKVTFMGNTFSVSNQFELVNNTLVPTKTNSVPNIIYKQPEQKVITLEKKAVKRKYAERKSLAKQKLESFENHYPKPAYSYSCLIAMALKNSRSGSLPVSEIYSFMCQHFPYFKTAPLGWKNSVRHNLSLNKCFEKIEKPVSDNSSRKGCLWAMNPEKISKMDEEVQKWSRKDPMGIKRAMVYPDTLESLERGEMKIGSLSYDDNPVDVEEDETEGEEELPEEEGRLPETESEEDEENELVLPYIPGGSDSEPEDSSSQDVDINKMYQEIDIKDSTIFFQSYNDTSAIKKAIISGNYICQPLVKQRKIVQNNYVTQTVSHH